jgi:lipopolysaccharide transport protein LptA
MMGAVQKISAIAVALGLGLLAASHLHLAFAQNEPEPEATPLAEPQAEPTEFTPITAGDAERGAPAPSAEAATSPASENSPAQSPTSAETASTAEPTPAPPAAAETPASALPNSRHSTISREPPAPEQHSESTESISPTPIAPIAKAPSHPAAAPGSSQRAGKTGTIVPENSPFAGMNFGNQKGPTNIKSDTATLDYQNKAVLFGGHVHAVQAGGDLTSDTLKVQYGQNFNDIKMMYADGNVRMSQATRWITSDHAVLDQTKHVLTFHGNPVVHDGEDQITGSVIVVDLVTGKSTVENPRVVIFPRESKNPDNGDAPVTP